MESVFHGLVELPDFLKVIGREKLQFVKGKGRAFCSTPVGVLFASAKYDPKKKGYITQAGEGVMTTGENPTSLQGTLWLVNSVVVDAYELDANGIVAPAK